mgnify:CR=1 FL=1
MKYIIIALGMIVSSGVVACDNCNVYLGINPNDFSHSVQLLHRWSFREGSFNQYGQQILRHGGMSEYHNSELLELFSTYEVRGRVFLDERTSILASIPFRNNYRAINNVTRADAYGLGDPLALINFRILNSKLTDSNSVNHQLTLIGGLKLPFGKHNAEWNDKIVDHDMQPGTGSFDFISGFDYYVKVKYLGLNVSANYKMNTTNADKFRFGNRTNLMVGLFSNLKVGKLKLLPHLGTYYELSSSDVYRNELVEDSEVATLFSRGSLGVFFGKWSLNGEVLWRLKQKLGQTNLKEGHRFRWGLTYFFN